MEIIGERKINTMTPIRYGCFALSILGLAASAYLTIAHFTSSSILVCPSTGTINCAKVTSSNQSYFLHLPVAIWGLLFYVFLTIINSPAGFSREALRIPRLGSMLLGIAFVLWLIYAELLIINSICLWCTSVHLITLLLFGAVTYDFFTYSPLQGPD